jgi:uncharacterized protein
LADGGRLADAPGDAAKNNYSYRPSVGITTGRRGLGSTTPWAMPIDQRLDEAFSLLFSTEPLREPLELLGEPVAQLHVSSTAEVAYFHVKLCDVAPDGTSRLICDGGLLATHRNSHEAPEKLLPGQVYALRIALRHCAYAINTIYLGGRYASHIVLPMAPTDPEPLPPPAFMPSPHTLPVAETLAPPEYRFELDLVNDTVSCLLQPAEGGRTNNSSRYTVWNRHPARAVIASSATHVAVHPTLDIRVEATCQTSSDEASYTHLSQVRITVNGAVHFDRSWSASVPRKLS